MSFKTLPKKPRGDGTITLNVRLQDGCGGFRASVYIPIAVIDRLGWDGGRYLVEAGKDEDRGMLRIRPAVQPDVAYISRALPRNGDSGGLLSIPYGLLQMTADAGRYNLPIVSENDQSITLDMTSHCKGEGK